MVAGPNMKLARGITEAISVRPARDVSANANANAPLLLPMLSEPTSECAAGFRLLARVVQRATCRTIAVTSPNAREGKTYCSLNLALALAERGEGSILLVEANLSSPSLAEILGITLPRDLAQGISSETPLASHLHQFVEVGYPNLRVLAADPLSPKPNVLSAAAFGSAMRQLEALPFMHIIVDGPSVFGSADTAVIEDQVDALVMCAATGKTRLRDLKRATTQLAPARILANVLLTLPRS
jgi:protein-tyrosine kinase